MQLLLNIINLSVPSGGEGVTDMKKIRTALLRDKQVMAALVAKFSWRQITLELEISGK